MSVITDLVDMLWEARDGTMPMEDHFETKVKPKIGRLTKAELQTNLLDAVRTIGHLEEQLLLRNLDKHIFLHGLGKGRIAAAAIKREKAQKKQAIVKTTMAEYLFNAPDHFEKKSIKGLVRYIRDKSLDQGYAESTLEQFAKKELASYNSRNKKR